MNTLICDDSHLIQDRIASELETIEGINKIDKRATVEDSIQFISTKEPDLVTIDLGMPTGSGLRILEFIKKEHPHIIAIVITNYAIPIYRKKCIELGAYGFIDKSSEFEKVRQYVSMLLNPYKKRVFSKYNSNILDTENG